MTTEPQTDQLPTLAQRMDTLYRLRTEQAETKAAMWERIAESVMAQNQELSAILNDLKRRQSDIEQHSRRHESEVTRSFASIEEFVTKAESVIRRALAVIDGSSTEDKTEVREALAALLNK